MSSGSNKTVILEGDYGPDHDSGLLLGDDCAAANIQQKEDELDGHMPGICNAGQ